MSPTGQRGGGMGWPEMQWRCEGCGLPVSGPMDDTGLCTPCEQERDREQTARCKHKSDRDGYCIHCGAVEVGSPAHIALTCC